MEQILLINLLALWLLVILNLLITLGLARRVNTALPKKDELKIGQKAPDFTAQTLDGKTLSLKDFSGRALVLIFFSPDCSVCGEVLLGIKQLKSITDQVGAELILIGDQETNSLRTYTQGLEVDLPIIAAPLDQNRLLIDYKASTVPWLCIIDEYGKVQVNDFGLFENIERGLFVLRKKGGAIVTKEDDKFI